jgi:rSAM/selenodomain-associated transferase 2
MLTIVVPAFNAEKSLANLLGRLAPSIDVSAAEVLVVDGGSTDETRRIAIEGGAVCLTAERGRGQQLAAGAAAAGGDWLLFVHADTRLPAKWKPVVAQFIGESANRRRAGYFRFALDDSATPARWIERAVLWRNRILGLPYGDQGLLISRAFYRELGGYKPLPLMEDVDFVRRIGRRRLVMLDGVAVTSADRYRREGYLSRVLRNFVCLSLYAAGVPARVIAGIYR